MFYWTLKSFVRDRLSVMAGAVGIMLALVLALYIDAVFRGEARQIVAFIERTAGGVWVLQDGVQNLHMARSRLSDDTIAEIARAPGVASVSAIVYREANVGDRRHQRVAYVVGVPADAQVKARWQRATGWPMPKGEGVVLPEPMAQEFGRKVGDKIRLGRGLHRIVALSQGTFSMANPLVFMDERSARRELDVPDGASFVLVEPAGGVSAEILATRINTASKHVNALTREQLLRNDYILALQMGGALIWMLSIVATVVSTLIIVFTAYAFVSARTAELAVVKALGAPRRQLLASAVVQTCVVAAIGCALAVVVIGPAQAVLTAWVPDVAVDFSYGAALRLSASTIVIAAVAALVPTAYVLSVDPALVFKG